MLPSLSLALGALTAPWVAAKTTLTYYTTGTVYQKTDPEFDTLYKNVVVAVLAHLLKHAQLQDARLLPYPMKVLFDKLASSRAARYLPHYGESVAGDTRFLWLARPERAKKAVLYLHGGGYLNPLAQQQLAGMVGVWYAVNIEKRYKLGVAVLDYLLTLHGQYYPTQIFEAVSAYRTLTEAGYEVILFGDSCGANLALAVARFAAYPEEARAHFSQYLTFSWDFLPLPAPRLMVLLAPWILPSLAAKSYPGVNHQGEFVDLAINEKGKLYTRGREPDQVTSWAEFGKTTYKDWAQVPAINSGSVLYIYGEREYFREDQERFAAECEIKAHMQPGGIHDNMFVVELLGLKAAMYSRAMEEGAHREKYTFSKVAEFLEGVL